MEKYREFMLETDPNPYVRSRWGFKEWSVAPEPEKAKALLNQIYDAEEMNRWYKDFIDALEEDPFSQERKENQAHQEIERLLHEMGQPLISKMMMRNRVEQLLAYIKACDEVSSPHYETINYIEDVFSKALRLDWKYHLLHEFTLFKKLYNIHQGLVERVDDPAHAYRIERFNNLFDQIERWVRKGDVYSHIHEIEVDINDMKTYLQDFLAVVQRASKEKSVDPFLDDTIQRFRHQLLEYRYLFGQFFNDIMSRNNEGQQLRNQFLYVDQYFETLESLLNELKVSWEGTGENK
ncbi:MAG: hypothetical protein H0W88_01050 [Parachlamydiaceae bacterium]|nr:hypothetical protein [Parachlamydiaceae bacterium]